MGMSWPGNLDPFRVRRLCVGWVQGCFACAQNPRLLRFEAFGFGRDVASVGGSTFVECVRILCDAFRGYGGDQVLMSEGRVWVLGSRPARSASAPDPHRSPERH